MLLLTDRMTTAPQMQQILQRLQPCEVAVYDQGATTGRQHGIIVCDVALDRPRSVEMLRNALASHRSEPRTHVLCLLRDPSHVTRGQAQMAGATATLVMPVTPEQLTGAVAKLIGTDRAGAPAASAGDTTRAAVRDAGKILASLFKSGAARQAIASESLERGGSVLLSAIRQTSVQGWLDVVWTYDDATYQHCLLVAGLTAAFTLELGLPPSLQHTLSQAALVHDIGKAQVPLAILNKAGRLTPAETAIMRSHVVAGHRMLAGQKGISPDLLDVTLHHHEYLDGTGYPDGLRGSQISRMVRIVTVCDIFAALIERRPYRSPMPARAALDHLENMGPKLDQALVKAFRNVMRET